MDKASKIYISGHDGMVGRALLKLLSNHGYHNIITASKSELDLRDQIQVDHFFESQRPEYVFHLAGKVGGVQANRTFPVEFFNENMQISLNVIKAAADHDTKKLLNLACSCLYPKRADQPVKESEILEGQFEPTNEAFALAKLGALKMCQFYQKQYGKKFITVIPPNAYGEHDDFDPENSHVVAAIMRKVRHSQLNKDDQIEIWGTGKPKREFIYVDDLAEGLVFTMDNYDDLEPINLGTDQEISIAELVEKIMHVAGLQISLKKDQTKPDGMMRKKLENSKIKKMGWRPKVSLDEGLKRSYDWAIENKII